MHGGSFVVCFIMSFALGGCAGPMSPFGAINGFGRKARNLFSEILPSTSDGALIRFLPARQVLHGPTNFAILIEDPEGVPPGFELTLIYNSEDVTESFLSVAQRNYLDPLHRQLKITGQNLRLPADKDHQIVAVYRHDDSHDFVVREYAPPSCSAFETERGLASLPQFQPGPGVLESINRYSKARHLNPFLVAGLIAQESSFDPRALSPSKALGLTQITALGESEVIKRGGEWPRWPAVANMSVLELRLAILTGEIHAGNEWRLNPDLSVRGGVEYLDYISNYWQKPEKREQVDRYLGATDLAFSELILASYNSGPARVSEALDKRGVDWLKDDSLNEARRYVRRVSSFCDHFPRERREGRHEQ